MKLTRGLVLLLAVAGLTACGPGLRQGMVRVPAGGFSMGCRPGTDGDCDADEKPWHEVWLDAYQIDEHEVTIAEYRACVDAGVCTLPATDGGCNWGQEGRDAHPANCTNWFQAMTYCRWAGKDLPTEAQWEKAARGTDGRVYPWGDEAPDCTRASMEEGSPGCGTGGTLPACSRPAGKSPYGACDMSGNVMEWVYDPQDPGFYGRSPEKNPIGDDPAIELPRVLRGGERGFTITRFLRACNRDGLSPIYSNYGIGFRCVYEER